MNRIFIFYGAAILIGFMAATYEGYAASSMFEDRHHSGPGSGGSGVHYYHSYHK